MEVKRSQFTVPRMFPLRVNITASMMSLFKLVKIFCNVHDLWPHGSQSSEAAHDDWSNYDFPPFFCPYVDTNKQRSTWAYFPASPLIFRLSAIQWSPSQPHPSVAFKFDQTERKWLLWDCLIDGSTGCVERFHDGISNTTAPLTGSTASRACSLHQEIPNIYVK